MFLGSSSEIVPATPLANIHAFYHGLQGVRALPAGLLEAAGWHTRTSSSAPSSGCAPFARAIRRGARRDLLIRILLALRNLCLEPPVIRAHPARRVSPLCLLPPHQARPPAGRRSGTAVRRTGGGPGRSPASSGSSRTGGSSRGWRSAARTAPPSSKTWCRGSSSALRRAALGYQPRHDSRTA